MQQKTTEWLLSFNSRYQDQINALLQEKRATPSKTITVSVTGGKGGVGKTSISLKMAKTLASMGKRVLLIDCDYNLSNTAIKLGLPINNNLFYSLVSASKPFEECLHRDGNFHLLSACSGSIELFDSDFRMEEVIIDIMNSHDKDYDFILLDCPAGITRESLTLNAYCDHRFLVVTPDKASITDSYSLVKVLSHKFGIKENHLIVNMFNSSKQFERVVKTLSETIENFLGCRTHILGGVKKINVDHSRFDHFFLAEEANEVNRDFFKVVRRYTEQLSRLESTLNSASEHHLEQDVH